MRTEPASAGRLDPQSRRVAWWFVLRLGLLGALAYGPCLAAGRTWHDGHAIMALACALGSVVGLVSARRRGDPVGRGSLNAWDDALAFVAASRLAHMAAGG